MNREKLQHSSNDDWNWVKAGHQDVEEIIQMAEQQYGPDVQKVLTTSPTRMAYHLHRAILDQTYIPHQELISVARHKFSNKLLAWAWITRGKFMPYADEEVAVAEFSHTDLALPLRTRMRLVGQTFDQWILWCELHQIPVLCSTSIRDDQKGFMKLHENYGFLIQGSFAYRRIV